MPANYVLLERIELNASVASVTFANIPQSGYTDLKIVVSARNDAATTVGGLWIRFNGLNSNLSSRVIYGTGSAAGSFSDTQIFAYSDAASATACTFSNVEYYIPNYAGSAYKSVSVDSTMENNATASSMALTAGLWSSTAAITSMEILTFNNSNSAAANFVLGSTFSLYGLAAVGTTPAIAPKAAGGNIISTDGTYWYHAFLTSGTFVPQIALTCDALVIGSGGGGGAGGGGAGKVQLFSTQAVSSTTTITVGAGGAGSSGSQGSNGNISKFAALADVIGGGGGGSIAGSVGSDGASGGGGGTNDSTGFGGGTGSAGGNGGSGSLRNAGIGGGGGGGGAGGNGSNADSSSAGPGGSGINTYSSWATATNTGVSGFYAGGGGGWVNLGNQASGGSGGGGLGYKQTGGIPGSSGVAGTGSGGGGTTNSPTIFNGGSGIVIVRYLAA
jgi:hypothetical protein